MVNGGGGATRGQHGDQDGLTRPLDKSLVVHVLSCMAEVHIMLASAGIGLEEVSSPIGHDAHIVAEPPRKVV